MSRPRDSIAVLSKAIREARMVRLAYLRKADQVLSLHEVAPIDIRLGWTPATAQRLYLWAWCFVEDKPEMHLLDRVRKVSLLEDRVDPVTLLGRWPIERWPIPDEWQVPRSWGEEAK